jgi:hypothetical protein
MVKLSPVYTKLFFLTQAGIITFWVFINLHRDQYTFCQFKLLTEIFVAILMTRNSSNI